MNHYTLTDIFGINIEVLTGVGIPSVTAAIFVIRHFIIKTKCFYLLKQRVESQEKETTQGKKDHKELYDRLGKVEKQQVATDSKLDLLLTHFKLKK